MTGYVRNHNTTACYVAGTVPGAGDVGLKKANLPAMSLWFRDGVMLYDEDVTTWRDS